MSNPDVIEGEEITTWTWIATLSLIAVLVAAVVYGGTNSQMANINADDVSPPITHQIEGL